MSNKPNLDLLRAIAICLVLLDHILLANRIFAVGPWLAAWVGVLGVYLFFVHTCLVLMWSLERKPHTLDFYIRRVFRIYPLAMVAVVAALASHAPVAGTPEHFFLSAAPTLRGAVTNLFLVQNLIGGGNVLGVLWSLPLEVDMYLLLPVLFFFVRKNFSVWPLLLMWGLAVALARPALASGNHFFTVVPCFLPGVMAYVLYGRSVPRFPAWLFPVFLGVLGALYMRRPSVGASWPLCLALGLGLPMFRQIRFAPLRRASHELAKYSYGLYLSHPFGIVLGFYLLSGRPWWLQLGVMLGSTAVLSVAAYHLVEKPMIDLGARVAARAEQRYEQKQLAGVT